MSTFTFQEGLESAAVRFERGSGCIDLHRVLITKA